MATEEQVQILLVDDDPRNLTALEVALADLGETLVQARSGPDALRHLLQGDFAVILLDVQMVGMDGFETALLIRSRPRSADTPIIFLTAQHEAPEFVHRGYALGAVDYLFKPIDPHVLRAKVGVFVELYRSELRVRRAHEQLQRAQSQLVETEKLAALGQLVAGVAHEINNPLAFVINNLSVLTRDVGLLRELVSMYEEGDGELRAHAPALRGRIEEFRERIDLPYTLEALDDVLVRSKEGLSRIQRIVADLRDFARLDRGDLHEADLNEGVRLSVGILRHRAEGAHVALTTALEPLPPVMCWPAKLNQVALNLIVNAIDACSPGGAIAVRTRAKDDAVEIEVEDTGGGIDPAIRDKIFDPFFTTKPPGQGTGLGLSISYGIVQAHGGTIAVDSTPGEGTRFTVTLPLRKG